MPVDTSEQKLTKLLTDHYRCPAQYGRLTERDMTPPGDGYFRFGSEATCYGPYSHARLQPGPAESLADARGEVSIDDGSVVLPFDASRVIDNLRRELYVQNWRDGGAAAITDLYYLIRPLLPVRVRRHLQRFQLRDWSRLAFPRWPVDCSVENLMGQLLLLSLRASRASRIPFIWFWPEGRPACAIMTHDVETKSGCDFCPTLMSIDDSYGIKASFQIIPEERYQVQPELLELIRRRDFEIAIHDLNHDGHLFRNREQFLVRAAQINAYAEKYGAEGFRAAVLYRKQLWYDALKLSYDMSVPNVAHLDPQRGGCCTVMPYFIGDILEIPVTTVQDYSLFNILGDYSVDLWKQQIAIIMSKHGCMNFIVHPDYVRHAREREVYQELLAHLSMLRAREGVWIATPGEVNRWWRQRHAMRLVEDGGRWRVQGPGSERARLAYASEVDGQLAVTLADPLGQEFRMETFSEVDVLMDRRGRSDGAGFAIASTTSQ